MKILKATKKHLSKRQKQVLDFVVSYLATNQYAPTEQEVADFLGKKRSYAQMYINILIEKGYLRRKKGWRNLEVINV